ncbi:MAG TPA: hemerythrin domain-containing protein [Burkholderiales bacterium]
MEFNRHISRRLHEEHVATLALWGRLESVLAAGRHDAALLKSAAASLERELDRHFRFEEAELFPRLAEAGEGDIGELLREEHETIRAAGTRFIALAKEDSLSKDLRTLGLELAERLVSHVQKEEMALLPALDDFIDEETDHELDSAYAAT